MTTRPFPLSKAEWKEIARLEGIRDSWDYETLAEYIKYDPGTGYAVKLKFQDRALGMRAISICYKAILG